MSVMDKLINAMKFNDDEFDENEELEEDYYAEDEEPVEEDTSSGFASSADTGFDDDVSDSIPITRSRRRERYSAAPAHDDSSSVTRQVKRQYNEAGMEVCIIKPTSVNDAREVTDTLLANSTVVLNLEGLDVEIAQRIIDFTSGSCYAVHGNVMKISHYIFVITPANVDVSGDISSKGTGSRETSSLNMPYGDR